MNDKDYRSVPSPGPDRLSQFGSCLLISRHGSPWGLSRHLQSDLLERAPLPLFLLPIWPLHFRRWVTLARATAKACTAEKGYWKSRMYALPSILPNCITWGEEGAVKQRHYRKTRWKHGNQVWAALEGSRPHCLRERFADKRTMIKLCSRSNYESVGNKGTKGQRDELNSVVRRQGATFTAWKAPEGKWRGFLTKDTERRKKRRKMLYRLKEAQGKLQL